MKKAVIVTGGKQYLVTEGEELEIERVSDQKKVSFTPLLTIIDKKISIGTPEVQAATVTAEVVVPEVKAEKVTAIRYKAKKRVRKIHGHRQIHTRIKISKITQE